MSETKTALGLLQLETVNCYHKALHLGCCSSPKFASKKQPSSVFYHTAVLNIFKNTDRRVLILVMTACESFIFKWTLTVKISLLCLLIQLKLTHYVILHHLELSNTFGLIDFVKIYLFSIFFQ